MNDNKNKSGLMDGTAYDGRRLNVIRDHSQLPLYESFFY